MKLRILSPALILLLSLFAPAVFADDAPTQKTPAGPKIDEPTRMALIRGLNAEMVFIRRSFPMGEKGLTIKDGQITPTDFELKRLIATNGTSVKPGDRAQISDVKFRGENMIVFEINGGPKKKVKWYQRVEISGSSGGMTPVNQNDPKLNSKGSYVILAFDKYVPKLSVDQVKKMLYPVFDFNALSAAQAYLDSLPPKVKDAIKKHQVLVGMNRDMVTYALGRPPRKHRETDGNKEWEEWIYGEPPQEVQFIRFMADEVVRVEVMKVGGEKVVRVEKEVDLKPTVAEGEEPTQPGAAQPGGGPSSSADSTPSQPTTKAPPTLRRPGEDPPLMPAPDAGTGKLPTTPSGQTTTPTTTEPKIPH